MTEPASRIRGVEARHAFMPREQMAACCRQAAAVGISKEQEGDEAMVAGLLGAGGRRGSETKFLPKSKNV